MISFSKNFVVIDVETTGLPDKNTPVSRIGVLEIGAVDAMGRRFYRRVAMKRGQFVQQAALEVNGIDALDLGVGVSIKHALCDLCYWLREDAYLGKWIMGGKNPQFDYSFLEANWPESDVEPLHELIGRRCVDLHSIAYGEALRAGKDMSGDDFRSAYQLYAELVGLEPEPMPHNAIRGAVHEMEGFRRLLLGAAATTPQDKFEEEMNRLARENLNREFSL